ncbi:hypothetical protein RCL1_000211 [Eukaryota sp. TZLM3-RCL]
MTFAAPPLKKGRFDVDLDDLFQEHVETVETVEIPDSPVISPRSIVPLHNLSEVKKKLTALEKAYLNQFNSIDKRLEDVCSRLDAFINLFSSPITSSKPPPRSKPRKIKLNPLPDVIIESQPRRAKITAQKKVERTFKDTSEVETVEEIEEIIVSDVEKEAPIEVEFPFDPSLFVFNLPPNYFFISFAEAVLSCLKFFEIPVRVEFIQKAIERCPMINKRNSNITVCKELTPGWKRYINLSLKSFAHFINEKDGFYCLNNRGKHAFTLLGGNINSTDGLSFDSSQRNSRKKVPLCERLVPPHYVTRTVSEVLS